MPNLLLLFPSSVSLPSYNIIRFFTTKILIKSNQMGIVVNPASTIRFEASVTIDHVLMKNNLCNQAAIHQFQMALSAECSTIAF